MANEIKVEPQLWEQFERAAREQRRNSVRLLAEVVREYLEIYEDEKLFRQMQRDARKSGYKEEDAVELVRQVRREMREKRGAAV